MKLLHFNQISIEDKKTPIKKRKPKVFFFYLLAVWHGSFPRPQPSQPSCDHITSARYRSAAEHAGSSYNQTITFPMVHTYVDVKAGGSGSAFDRLGRICSDVCWSWAGEKLDLSWGPQGNKRGLCGREYSCFILRCPITLIYDIITIGKHCQELGIRRAENGWVRRTDRVIFSLSFSPLFTPNTRSYFLTTVVHILMLNAPLVFLTLVLS